MITQYMIIMFLLFLVQFAVACACLALSESQQHSLYSSGWETAPYKLRERAQNLFVCCGYNKTTQDDIMSPTDIGGFGHPSCQHVICLHLHTVSSSSSIGSVLVCVDEHIQEKHTQCTVHT